MTTAQYIIGDVLAVLPTLPAGSVDLVICSPPFLALRSYLPADHPDKALEHGSEATPAAFLAQLLDVTELLGAVLASHGSICVELGDTFSGSSGGDGVPKFRAGTPRWDGRPDGQTRTTDSVIPPTGSKVGTGWPNPKSLYGVPAAYELSLAYGRNILALPGQPEWREFNPWRVRNHVAWCRSNPPVGALGDKFRPATSYITVATRSATRYWDDIPTRRPMAKHSLKYWENGSVGNNNHNRVDGGAVDGSRPPNSAGAPLLDWWEITPTGFTSRLGQHFATFPDAIAIPLVEAMCPRRVCRTCGTPSRRLVDRDRTADPDRPSPQEAAMRETMGQRKGWGTHTTGVGTTLTPVGWSTCGCPGTEQTRDDGFHAGDGWRPGMVLDCYAGTGTTLLVATGHGRDAIGVDLDARNAELARERIGFFLTVEEEQPRAS